MAKYTDVQFVGYAINTAPKITNTMGGIGGYIQGKYIGIEPSSHDIDARIELIMRTVDHTRASEAIDASPTTLKIFLMPEFLLRGALGAYDNDPPVLDYFRYFRTRFARRVRKPEYEDWLFAVGTLVSAADYVRGRNLQTDVEAVLREIIVDSLVNAWEYASGLGASGQKLAGVIWNMLQTYMNYCNTDHPLFRVTDRCYVVAGGAELDPDYPDGLSIRKEYLSNEDFVLNSPLFNNEDTDSSPIPENNGEDKEHAFDPYSIFTIKGIRFGVEICLDHLRARLLTNRLPDTELVQIHLVPSCGLQLVQSSIIAGTGGFAFNCDGESGGSLGYPPDSDASLWTSADNAHSQLTQVTTPCGSGTGGPQASVIAPAASVTVLTITDDPDASKLYPNGPGEVHVYSPLPVPPPVTTFTLDELLLSEEAAGSSAKS